MSSRRPLFIGCFFLFIVFSALRFAAITQRPYHHDEGVNTFFLRNLITSSSYKYDPQNYHGPSLYYFQLPVSWVTSLLKTGPAKFSSKSDTGLTPFSVRSMVALAGCVLLLVLLFSRSLTGLWGSLTAFALVGLSCDFIFLSRYFIHEIYLVLFLAVIVVGLAYFVETKHPVFLYAVGLATVLAFCTKETALLSFIVMALAAILTPFLRYLVDPRSPSPSEAISKTVNDLRPVVRHHLPLILIITGTIWFLLFSSFFKNMAGPLDSIRTYFYWGQEGLESGHAKRFLYYINDIIIRYELALFILAFLGIVTALIKNQPKGLFLSLWTVGTITMYSLIPYKTPWIIINLLLPMAFIAGYGVQTLLDEVDRQPQLANKIYVKRILGGAVILLLALQLPQTWTVNYKEYDNDKHPQVYGHTVRDIFNLLDEIDALAKKSGLDRNIPIEIVSGEYWPLPFYLMKYPSAHFWGKMEPSVLKSPLIIGESKQKAQLLETLKNTHVIKQFNLRPGLPLQLYIQQNLVEKVNVPHLDLIPAQETSASIKPGLTFEIYDGINFTGRPQSVKNGDTAFDFWWDVDTQKKAKSPFSFWWKGYIKIEKEGVYDFSLESDDGSWLLIDDFLIVDNGGIHGVQRMENQARLAAGLHKIDIKYFDQGGGAVLKAAWIHPDSNREAPLTQGSFFHEPPKN